MISIIIPCYNAGNYIKKAIDSAINQTYQDFEIIIIDDGSTDNSKQVISQFSDSRIKYIYQENQGVSVARNKGIELSHGEFIAFLDADDIWHPEKLKIQLDFLEKNPDISFVYSNITMIEESTGAKFTKTFNNFKTQKNLIKNLILTPFNTPSPCTVIVKKSCLFESGLFDPKIKNGEDLDLWLRIAMHSNFYCINKSLATAVRKQDGITRTMNPLDIIQNYTYILDKFFNETDKEKLYQKYKNKAFAFIYFNIGFHYFFTNNSKNTNFISTPSFPMAFFKKILRKIINLYISLI